MQETASKPYFVSFCGRCFLQGGQSPPSGFLVCGALKSSCRQTVIIIDIYFINIYIWLLLGGEKMAVKIRLKRMGAKKAPFYRIVVADSRTPRDGKAIEEIGYYDPTKNPAEVKLNVEAAKKWLSNGAQPSDTVRDLLKKAGAIE